jgi:hypothetical protein
MSSYTLPIRDGECPTIRVGATCAAQGKKFDASQPINDHNTYMNIGYLPHG